MISFDVWCFIILVLVMILAVTSIAFCDYTFSKINKRLDKLDSAFLKMESNSVELQKFIDQANSDIASIELFSIREEQKN